MEVLETPWYIVKFKATGLADELDVGCEGGDSKVSEQLEEWGFCSLTSTDIY